MTGSILLAIALLTGTSHGPLANGATESALRRAQIAAGIQDALTRAKVNGPSQNVLDFEADSVVKNEVLPFLNAPFSVAAEAVPTIAELRYVEALAESLLMQGANRFYPQATSIAAALTPPVDLGFPSEAALIGGLTNFLVERAKDEAAFAFVINLKDHAKSTFIRVGLPRSYTLISQMDTRTFQSFMPLLRTAFSEDLAALPRTVASKTFADSMNWTSVPIALQIASVAYDRGMALQRGGSPSGVLAALADVDETEISDEDLRLALRIAGLASREYAAAGGKDLIRAILPAAHSLPRTYFAAFLIHDAADLAGLDAKARSTLLAHTQQRLPDLMLFINQLDAIGQSAADAQPTSAAAIHSRALSALQILESASRLAPISAQDRVVLTDAIRDVLIIHHALSERDFTAIVTWIASSNRIKLDIEQMKYVSFAAALASAQTADDVATVLRASSAPIGSYRTKRTERFTASLTGYLGARYGSEDIETVDESVGAYGVALPVGPEVSVRTGIGALSLFAPLIDMGNFATFANDDRVSDAPEVGFEQLLSPGLFLVLNLGRDWPISIGGGVQSLRAYRDTDVQEKQNGIRTSVFVGIDATIFQMAF